MRTPDKYTTETGNRPLSQIAAHLAQEPLKPEHASNRRRQKSSKASPLHRK